MPRPTPAHARTAAPTVEDESTLRFSVKNLILLAAGLAVIVLGYVLLSGGDTVAAPLLLVLGYAVLIPLGIIL
jgi:fatty acid desaturase